MGLAGQNIRLRQSKVLSTIRHRTMTGNVCPPADEMLATDFAAIVLAILALTIPRTPTPAR
jgi:hypothetical protein